MAQRVHKVLQISVPTSIATMSLSCTVSEILSLISQNFNRSRDSEHIPFGSNMSCMHSYSSVSIRLNQYTKFEVPSFTNYKDMIGAKFKKGYISNVVLVVL